MATQRITVSVPVEIAARIRRSAGRSISVSAWVTHAVTRTLEEEDLRRRFLEFCDTIPATPAQERQAKASFERIVGGKRGKRGKRGKAAA